MFSFVFYLGFVALKMAYWKFCAASRGSCFYSVAAQQKLYWLPKARTVEQVESIPSVETQLKKSVTKRLRCCAGTSTSQASSRGPKLEGASRPPKMGKWNMFLYVFYLSQIRIVSFQWTYNMDIRFLQQYCMASATLRRACYAPELSGGLLCFKRRSDPMCSSP